MSEQWWNRVYLGSCERMTEIPDASVHTCVTSPPFYGLRDYGVEGQIGLEPTVAEYVERLVGVFREVRRVLRDDGTVWLNLGDSYAGSWGAQSRGAGDPNETSTLVGSPLSGRQIAAHPTRTEKTGSIRDAGLKPKDLIGIPWRVAFALQADGWYLRSDVVWSKPNPMPESVTDRPTRSHEYLFLLSKSGDALFWTHRDGRRVDKKPAPDHRWIDLETGAEVATAPVDWERATFIPAPSPERVRAINAGLCLAIEPARRWKRVNLWESHDYYYDADAIREPLAESSLARIAQERWKSGEQAGSSRANGGQKTNGPMRAVVSFGGTKGGGEFGASSRTKSGNAWDPKRRAPTPVDPDPHPGFSERWSWQAMAAGEPLGANARSVWTIATRPYAEAHFATFPLELPTKCIRATCPPGGIVLDPFMGSGTTAEAAESLGRHWVGYEINPEYHALIAQRTKQPGLFGGAAV